jgi:hypothetical protein
VISNRTIEPHNQREKVTIGFQVAAPNPAGQRQSPHQLPACFSFFGIKESPVTQDRAERNQFCRRGIIWSRWRKMPTRTM